MEVNLSSMTRLTHLAYFESVLRVGVQIHCLNMQSLLLSYNRCMERGAVKPTRDIDSKFI